MCRRKKTTSHSLWEYEKKLSIESSLKFDCFVRYTVVVFLFLKLLIKFIYEVDSRYHFEKKPENFPGMSLEQMCTSFFSVLTWNCTEQWLWIIIRVLRLIITSDNQKTIVCREIFPTSVVLWGEMPKCLRTWLRDYLY